MTTFRHQSAGAHILGAKDYLSQEHEEYLTARAVPLELARSCQLRTVTKHEGSFLVGWEALPSAGLAVRYLPFPEEKHTHYRIRLDHPRPRGPRWVAERGVCRPYIPPCLPPEILRDTSQELVIVESPIKALALCSVGRWAIGLAGSGGGHDKEARDRRGEVLLHPELRLRLSWEGRPVTLLSDSDRQSNRGVLRTEQLVAQCFENSHAQVFVAQLPHRDDGAKWGPDDFLAQKGKEALWAVLAQKKPAREVHFPPGGVFSREGFTDSGNAERLVYLADGEIRYCERWKKWLLWTGARWEEDEKGGLQRWAKKAAQSFFEDASEVCRRARTAGTDEALEAAQKKAEEISRWARTSLSSARRQAMITLAASEPGVAILPEELDQEHWLFNVQNGTIDLRTGELRPHSRADLLTKCSPVAYDPKAECPTFLVFLDKIMAGDQEMISCLQRGAGYSMTGAIREHVLFFLHGGGSNGKGTLLEVLLYLLGEYGLAASQGLLLQKRHEAHPTERASLFGKRLASCPEVQQGARWDEQTLKALTGGDTINARRMREDEWNFRPTHKLWVSGNHKPRVRGTDYAIWRRIKLIPFLVTIPEEDQDKALPEKLKAEAPGILHWMVQGCLAWQTRGLDFPHVVEEATRAYRESEDVVGRFLADCCIPAKGARVTSKELYEAYAKWCEEEGESPLSKKMLGERLEERGLSSSRTGHARTRGWEGFSIRT